MKIILLIFFVLVTSLLFSDDSVIAFHNQSVDTWILSPGFFTTLGYGFGEVSPNGNHESFTVLRAGLGPMFIGGGIYIHNRYFKDPERTGLFYTFDFGADVILGCTGDPGGSGAGCTPIPLPNLAGGIGYSKKLGDNSYFRISIDLGLKAVISNLNLSVTF